MAVSPVVILTWFNAFSDIVIRLGMLKKAFQEVTGMTDEEVDKALANESQETKDLLAIMKQVKVPEKNP